jgi:hypothetical protein
VEPFSAVVGGGIAGFFGAALAHVLTTLAERAGAQAWLRGDYGPPFFGAALYMGVLYAAIGAAAGRKALTAGIGFAGGFFVFLLPMFVLSRYAGWGMPRGADATPSWKIALIVVLIATIWSTIAAIGAASAPAAPARGALAAAAGSLAGYAVLSVLLKIFSSWAATPWSAASLIPSPVNLLDGLLSGAGLCLGLSLERRISRRTS